MCELMKQYEYYTKHEKELLDRYMGKYLVISDDLKVSAFDTKQEAYASGDEMYGLGNFMLQYCDYDAFHTVHFVNLGFAV